MPYKDLKKQRKFQEERRAVYIKRNKKYILDFLKENPCIICGEADPIVLDFDHLRDKKKKISRAFRGCWSIEKLKEEIDKCQVLCANCHRRKTAKQFNWCNWEA